jgi:hypothetical protein
LTRPRLVPTIYRTRGEHANHYATDAVPYFYLFFINLFNQNFLLLAHLAKGNVSFYHHLAPVVRRLSSVYFSHFNLLLWNASAKWSETAFSAEKQQIPIVYSFVWQDRGSYPQYIALEASTLTITLLMRFPIFIYFLFICLIKILAFTKSPSTEWSWFSIELIIRFLYLLCSWIITIFKVFIFFCLTRPRLVPTIYRTRGEHANHYATDAVPYFYLFFINLFNQNFLLSFTTAHSQNILHVDVLYNIKRKKYKTVCAELAFTKSPSTEWSWFSIELIILCLIKISYCPSIYYLKTKINPKE